MPRTSGARDAEGAAEEVADRLHSAAIHLLRRLRREDDASGLTAPRLSALSVIVISPGIRLMDLAAAEQVAAPTMSRLVAHLEAEGLVRRVPSKADGRALAVRPTAAGRRLLAEGRRRRVAALAGDVAALPAPERRALEGTLATLEALGRPAAHPERGGS